MMSIAYDYASEATPLTAISKPRLLLIDGQHVPSASGRSFKTLNPATEQVIATVAEGNEADVDFAVAAARRAFEGPWRTMRASERGQILLRLVELMKRHAEELGPLLDQIPDVAIGEMGVGRGTGEFSGLPDLVQDS